ncbi:hypothetical protein CP061683_1039B, partial [Chlamydia psittaci 06-1683]
HWVKKCLRHDYLTFQVVNGYCSKLAKHFLPLHHDL